MQKNKTQISCPEIYQAYRSFFSTYDQCNVGEISKVQLFYAFQMMDPRINQIWLQKILMTQGKKIKQFISKNRIRLDFEEFIEILEILRIYSAEESESNYGI